MTEHDESRPLSRRERRLLEQAPEAAESQAVEQQVEAELEEASAGIDAAAEQEIAEAIAAANIDISMVDENGEPRTRRELRQLRAEAEAAIAAEVLAKREAAAAESEAEAEAELAVVESEPVDAEEAEVEDVAVAEEAEAAEVESADAEVETETEAETEEADAEAEVEEDDAASDDDAQELEADQALAHAEAEAIAEIVAGSEAVESAEVDGDVDDLDEGDADSDAEPEDEGEPSEAGYSFPDIAPLDEGASVFDDPAIRMMAAAGSGAEVENRVGDFDDLISSAVAQEGTGSLTNTSALILPNMPSSDGLSGPLGDTGELYVTGSFDLPKSLSETGGHSAIHDSVEIDPLDELGLSEATPTDSMAPVSASRAVSMRSSQGSLVAAPTKEKSKMPVVLIATSGALVVGVAALIIWAAASGMFG